MSNEPDSGGAPGIWQGRDPEEEFWRGRREVINELVGEAQFQGPFELPFDQWKAIVYYLANAIRQPREREEWEQQVGGDEASG